MSAPSPHMHRALELARVAFGTTSPNPAVGAVVVKDGVAVGGLHGPPGGGPHAEVVALMAAGRAGRHRVRDAGAMQPLRTHAAHLGITNREVHELIYQVMYYAGWSVGPNAMRACKEVLAEPESSSQAKLGLHLEP